MTQIIRIADDTIWQQLQSRLVLSDGGIDHSNKSSDYDSRSAGSAAIPGIGCGMDVEGESREASRLPQVDRSEIS